MTLDELKQTEWYKERPPVIQKAIDLLPPVEMYKIKGSMWQCYIISYEEPESGNLKDVTCTVQKTGVSSVPDMLLLGSINTNKVFGVALNELEVYNHQ